MTEKETFNQAEVYRYFGCKNLQASVKSSVEAVLSRESFASVDDFYYANAIDQNV